MTMAKMEIRFNEFEFLKHGIYFKILQILDTKIKLPSP